MINRTNALLALVGTVVALNTIIIAFNSYRITLMQIDADVHRADDRAMESDVHALQEWRRLTQSNRFTSEHGAQLRNDMEINIGAIVQRLEALERANNERK